MLTYTELRYRLKESQEEIERLRAELAAERALRHRHPAEIALSEVLIELAKETGAVT